MTGESGIEAYRRMTPEERWRHVEELMTLAWRALQQLPDDERRRRLEVVREEHEASDAIMLEHIGLNRRTGLDNRPFSRGHADDRGCSRWTALHGLRRRPLHGKAD